jgi:tRNA (adenine57-N1/adenine58-N1)-methyltransferase
VPPQKVSEGDLILLSLGTRKTYLVRVEAGKSFHTHKGFVKFDDILGKDYGDVVKSSLNIPFIIMKPLLRDYVMKSARQTQINYPKDIALIIMFSSISAGSRVVEAGTGTGAMTTAIAHYVKPNGIVYSYDIREEFQKTAKKNLKRAGLDEFVELKLKDITQGVDETEVDAVILDLAVPWLVVSHAYFALKPCGTIVSFSPTIDQVVKTVEALKENSFSDVETVECLLRGMQIERGKTRPHTLMTGHTGYITFGRKVMRSDQDDFSAHSA